jgi:Lrp/AsnC family transcriptional regulator for asnA, asnC and gidA
MSHDLDSVDVQIIRILQQDGRASNVEIARRVGVSEATVRKRLERLISENVIRITAVPDSAKVDLATVTFIALGVDLSLVDRIADQLAQAPEVRAIYYTTGENDLIVEAWFSSGDELLRFLTQRVASIPGIHRTATSHVLRVIKDSSRWILPPGAPARILIVDDDPDFVEITRAALAIEGFEVSSASNGQEALALMRVHRPDLVILDIMMQGILDGLRTAEEMRADSDLRRVPILMVSSITDSAFSGLLPRVKSLPVDNFMAKPIEMSVLLAETKRLLRSR